MKILIVNHEYPPVGGGGAFFCRDLAQTWAGMGHEVDVVTSRAKGLLKKEKKNGVNIYRAWAGKRTDFQKANFLNLLFFDMAALFFCSALLIKNKYDFINTHFAVPAGPVGLILQLIFRKKNILVIHGADIFDPTRRMSGHQWKLTKFFGALAMNKATAVVAATEEIKNKAKENYRLKKEIKIIPLGFRLDKKILEAPRTYGQNEKIKLITLGRLVGRKNIELLLGAAEKLKERIVLTIVGEGPERKKLEKHTEELGINEVVSFVGFLDEDTKNQELLNHDLFILTSFHEGFGVVFLEAMQAGLPIVASNIGGQKYFLEDGENALFFEDFTAAAVANKIEYFFENREKFQEFGKRNREKAKEYDIDRIAKRYLDLIA